MQLVPGQHIHLVGVGGAGMSAIARVLLQQGYMVSGSDRSANDFTESLKHDGATIYKGHDPVYVVGAEMVIISSAIPSEHIEVLTARAQGIPIYKRSDVISAIMAGHVGIAIAGTHGKTTTTAMTTHILLETGQSPSYIIGGTLKNTGHNAGVGTGKAFVTEADEYDNMFHGLRPQIEVITSVEYDHPDFFRTPKDMVESFSHFVGLLPNDGLLVVCADDPTALIFGENRIIVNLPTVTYGVENQRAMWQAANLRTNAKFGTTFDVLCDGQLRGMVALTVPGKHNVLNALSALIVADNQGVAFEDASAALNHFEGTGRRFEVRGEIEGVVVVDDYAHHPTAIEVTIDAARQRYPDHQLWAVWQPHTYSRTQTLMDQYLTAFKAAHHVLVTDIYAAREKPVAGVSSADIVAAMQHPDARHTPDLWDAVEVLDAEVQPPAVILVMSAGDAIKIGEDYLQRRREKLNIPNPPH
jgi:UDP-N-acetylmuramate--alanine ligase